jgi:hypothetical protein
VRDGTALASFGLPRLGLRPRALVVPKREEAVALDSPFEGLAEGGPGGRTVPVELVDGTAVGAFSTMAEKPGCC